MKSNTTYLSRSFISILEPRFPVYSRSANTSSTILLIVVLASAGRCRYIINQFINSQGWGAIYSLLLREPCWSIFFQHLHYSLRLEVCAQCLVWPGKNDSVQTIKFFKLDWGWWADRYEANDGRFHLWWWSEVISWDMHDIIDFCVKLMGGEYNRKLDALFIPGHWQTI